MNIERGFRGRLSDYLNASRPITVTISTSGGAVYDTFCFGLDEQEQIPDDAFVIFYNQLHSPGDEIVCTLQEQQASYDIQLRKLPGRISKLVFAISIDGEGTMHDIRSHRIQLLQDGNVCMEVELDGTDFQKERVIIGIELYYKDEWRIAVVARGFNNGLQELLRRYHVETEQGDCSI